MRKIFLLTIFCLLFVSCTVPFIEPYSFTYNPFIVNKLDISSESNVDSISFSLVADSHYGRAKSTFFNDEYYKFLEENRYPFIIHLGDFTDTGVITDSDMEFLYKAQSLTSLNRLYVTLGNHDRHNLDSRWDSSNQTMFTSAACYYYGKTEDSRPLLAIYKIDTSADTIGWKQFEHLEKALEKETAVYRIIVSHENVAIGNRLSPTMVIFGLSSDECNKLYALMEKYNVGLILSGHNHMGNIEYHLTDTIGELNLAAFHRKITKPVQYESMGYWYDFTLDAETGEVTINGYLAENGKKDRTFTFFLPKN